MLNRQDLLGALQSPAAVPQFNAFAAGRKVYGGGRAAPNVGRTANKVGYGRRDAMQRAITGGI